MILSKLSPLLCVLAVGAICFTVRAEDNTAQAAARAALANQLFDMNASATNAPTAAAPAATVSVAATPSAPEMHPVDSDAVRAQAKADKAAAKAKAKQDAADLKAKQDADKKLASQKAADAKTAAGMAKSDAEKKAAAEKAALTTKPVIVQPVATNDYAGKDLGMKQMIAPALPINSSKADRLQALLVKYQADQLTPDEYHRQRAAILNEP